MPWWLWVGIALSTSAVTTFAVSLAPVLGADSTDYGSLINWLNVYAALGQFIVAAAAFWAERRQRIAARPATIPAAMTAVRRIVADASNDELRRRGLHTKLQLQLRWRPWVGGGDTGEGLTGSLIGGGTPTRPAAGLVEGLRRLPNRRLVIVGDIGAGKSTLALLFTLAALDQANDDTPSIPMLLSMASWRPEDESLRDFVIRRVPEEYPAVTRTPQLDRFTLEHLYDEGHILPVLDGLDEIAQQVRPAAIGRLNEVSAVGSRALVVTCRRDAYQAALDAGEALDVDGSIVIDAVPPSDVVAYLSGPRSGSAARWAPVADRILAEPSGPLATALSTPLMTGLAGVVYEARDAEPAELLALTTRDQVEDRLLGRFLRTIHPDDQQGRRYDRPLSILAYYLEPDIAWWELVLAVPSIVVVSVVAATFGVVGGALSFFAQPLHDDRLHNLLFGLVFGLAIGLPVGLSSARSSRPHHLRRARWMSAGSVVAVAVRDSLVAMAAAALGIVAIRGTSLTSGDLIPLASTLTVIGLISCGVALIANGLSAGRGLVPSHTDVNLRALWGWLATGLALGLVVALPASGVIAAVAGVKYGWLNAISTGLSAVAAIGVATGVPVGIGRWLGEPRADTRPPAPAAMLRSDRTATIIAGLASAMAAGTACAFLARVTNALELDDFLGWLSPVRTGLVAGLTLGTAVVAGSGSPWFSYVIARGWFVLVRRRLPWNLIRFLDVATDDQVMRCNGSTYQFRHGRLRAYLSQRMASHSSTPAWLIRREPRSESAGPSARRPRTAPRRAVTAAALLALVSGIAVSIGPPVTDAIERGNAREAERRARTLTMAADDLQLTDPDMALRLRLAAAAIDSDGPARDDLAAFVHMRVVGPSLFWMRTNRVVRSGPWVVTLDARAVATAWDRRAASPTPIVLGRDVLDVTATGVADWVELVGLDDHARLVHLDSSAIPPAFDIGIEPDRIDPLGTTGWIVARRDDRLIAWNLNTTPPQSTGLSTASDDSAVVAGTGWVVVVAGGQAAAWRPESARMTTFPLGSQVGSVAVHPPAIVDLNRVDGSTISQWALPAGDLAPVELRGVFGGLVADPLSTADGHWVFVDRDGTIGWNLASDQVTGRRLPGGRMVAAGPAEQVVMAADGVVGTIDLATAALAVVALTGGAVEVRTDSSPLIDIRLGSGRHQMWDLTASPPVRIEVEGSVGATTAAGDVTFVARDPDGSAWFWDLTQATPRRTLVGRVANAVVSTNGQWVISTYTQETVENLTAVWGTTAQVVSASGDPVAAACDVVGRGLTPTEWARYVPDAGYHQTC